MSLRQAFCTNSRSVLEDLYRKSRCERIATAIPNCPDVMPFPYGNGSALDGLYYNRQLVLMPLKTPPMQTISVPFRDFPGFPLAYTNASDGSG